MARLHASFVSGALFILLLLAPGIVHAFSLGELQLLSTQEEAFRAAAAVKLGEGETITAVEMGSKSDYGLLNLPYLNAVSTVTAQIKQQDGKPFVWLQGVAPIAERNFYVLLRVSSNHHTYFPFFQIRSPIQTAESRAQRGKKPVEQPATQQTTEGTPPPIPAKQEGAAIRVSQVDTVNTGGQNPQTTPRETIPTDPVVKRPDQAAERLAAQTKKQRDVPPETAKKADQRTARPAKKTVPKTTQKTTAPAETTSPKAAAPAETTSQKAAAQVRKSTPKTAAPAETTPPKAVAQIRKSTPKTAAPAETTTPQKTAAPVRRSTPKTPVSRGNAIPGSTTYGPIQNNENLTEIARRFKQNSSASIFQILTAIWQHNPNQFIRNNMNGLKVGATLTIPTEEAMLRVNNRTARTVRLEHAMRWRTPPTAPKKAPQTPTSIVLLSPATQDEGAYTEESDLSPPEEPPARLQTGQQTPDQTRGEDGDLRAILVQLQVITNVLENNQGQTERLERRVATLEQQKKAWDLLQARMDSLEHAREMQVPMPSVSEENLQTPPLLEEKWLLWGSMGIAASGLLGGLFLLWLGRRWNRADHWNNLRALLSATAQKDPDLLVEALQQNDPVFDKEFAPAIYSQELEGVSPQMHRQTLSDDLVETADKLKSVMDQKE